MDYAVLRFLLFYELLEINFLKLFSRIWSSSSKKTLRRENASFLQKTPSQCKQTFFPSVLQVRQGWDLRGFLLAKSRGRGCWVGSKLLFFLLRVTLAVQPHLSFACTTPFIVTACLARLHVLSWSKKLEV